MNAQIKKITQNRLLMGAIFLLAAIGVYLAGSGVPDGGTTLVEVARQWILIIMFVFCVNFSLAWYLANSWPVSMGRMLITGLFAYICISEFVEIAGGAWGFWGQLLGGEGSMPDDIASATRYSLSSWGVGIAMMIYGVAVGFEGEQTGDSGDAEK